MFINTFICTVFFTINIVPTQLYKLFFSSQIFHRSILVYPGGPSQDPDLVQTLTLLVMALLLVVYLNPCDKSFLK